MKWLAIAAGISNLLVPSRCRAQTTVRRIALGFAVDSSRDLVGDLVRTVVAYFSLPHPGRTPTALWNRAEQDAGALYDLSARDLYTSGQRAIIVGVDAANVDSALFTIKTLFLTSDSLSGVIEPYGLQRLFALRVPKNASHPYGWELSGAIAHLPRSWPLHVVGTIRYHAFPGMAFNAARADSASRFLAQVARCIGVSGPPSIDYYVTPSWEEVQRLAGMDWSITGTAFAGRAFPEEHVLLAGNPRYNEFFRHELAHMALAGVGRIDQRSRLADEGVATWLGGGNRGDVAGYYALLAAFQRTHPDVTLEALSKRFDVEAEFYATGALIAAAVYQRSGASGLREMLGAYRDDAAFVADLPRLLGVQNVKLDEWWRAAAQTPPSGCK